MDLVTTPPPPPRHEHGTWSQHPPPPPPPDMNMGPGHNTPLPPPRDTMILCTGGRYASYWNAFLSNLDLECVVDAFARQCNPNSLIQI